ncbi:hypothetical protein [Sporolactobacillus pectinivorans]|uniref:hypothetical protein n=1 Tax=Sporolactobacillus pectinivorans TaxID=1591408 RepID=UPI000C26A16E|nr:hypothetical protein [Sporolactobacillus pectinivorans]
MPENLINYSDEIMTTIDQLGIAKKQLKQLQEELKSEPSLSALYAPSAEKLVSDLNNRLQELITKQTGSVNEYANENVDIWIRIKGKGFNRGKGPIGQIGNFLNRLNIANAHAVGLLEKKLKNKLINVNDLLPSFDLVKTSKGSLKLGLKPSLDLQTIIDKQMSFFDDKEQNGFDQLKKIDEASNIALDSFKLLTKALAASNDNTEMDDLKRNFDEKDVIKLLYYVRELAPSNRSDMDEISFESPFFGKSAIIADRGTRKLLSERAKSLVQTTDFIEGKAAIREIDLDNKTVTARPLSFNNTEIDDIKLKFPDNVSGDKLMDIVSKIVYVSGFLNFNFKGEPIDLAVEDIELNNIDEDSE